MNPKIEDFSGAVNVRTELGRCRRRTHRKLRETDPSLSKTKAWTIATDWTLRRMRNELAAAGISQLRIGAIPPKGREAFAALVRTWLYVAS